MRFPEFNEARAASVGGDALVDDTIDRYVDWREACRTVRTRYERWSGAPMGERTERFAAYHAALDREEGAAQLYADSLARLTRVLWPDRVAAS